MFKSDRMLNGKKINGKKIAILSFASFGFISFITCIVLFLYFIVGLNKNKDCQETIKLEKTCVNLDWQDKINGNKMPLKIPVYLDYQATTPIDPRVLSEMQFVESNIFGNANSLHQFGQKSMQLVEKARKQVASVIGASANEIVFTSGATESNNLAIKGMIETYSKKTGKKHIITSMTEHACIQETCKKLESEEYDITYLCPKEDGLVDLKELEDAIRPDTLLISIMGVNNEIGVIQDLKAIGKIARKHNVYFHTDCAQAFGKIPLDVDNMNIDLMSISGHKIYGPKGIGAIYIRQRGKHKINLLPQINGGGQEQGIRSGTLAVPLIVGLGKASEIMKTDFNKDKQHIERMSHKLKHGIMKIKNVRLNGNEFQRYKGNLNFSFKDIDAMQLVMNLSNKVALSIGSACGSSHNAVDSYVIKALGINSRQYGGAVRMGIGRFTTEAEIDYAIKVITEEVEKLRKNNK